MDRDDARRQAMLDYTEGRVTRSVAMQRLGFTWYGQLLDAMSAAGLRMHVPVEAEARMQESLRELFGDRSMPSPPKAVRRHPATAAAAITAASSLVLRRCRRAARPASAAPRRGIRFGWLRGQIVVPDDFDAPLPANIFSD